MGNEVFIKTDVFTTIVNELSASASHSSQILPESLDKLRQTLVDILHNDIGRAINKYRQMIDECNSRISYLEGVLASLD